MFKIRSHRHPSPKGFPLLSSSDRLPPIPHYHTDSRRLDTTQRQVIEIEISKVPLSWVAGELRNGFSGHPDNLLT
jgi:hypothetical protein